MLVGIYIDGIAYGRLRILSTIIHSIKTTSVLSSKCKVFLQKTKTLLLLLHPASFLSLLCAAILFHFIFLIIYF